MFFVNTARIIGARLFVIVNAFVPLPILDIIFNKLFEAHNQNRFFVCQDLFIIYKKAFDHTSSSSSLHLLVKQSYTTINRNCVWCCCCCNYLYGGRQL